MLDSDMDIYLVVFDEKSFSLSTELYGDIAEYINDNYVDEKSRQEYEGYRDSYPTEGRQRFSVYNSMAGDHLRHNFLYDYLRNNESADFRHRRE